MRNVKGMMMSGRDDWETPDKLYKQLHAEFCFGVDAAASFENAKSLFYIDKDIDALSVDWSTLDNLRTPVFCNPPYGRDLGKWVKKAYKESLAGSIVVMLIPARTDTKWFHEFVYKKAEIRFIKGRLTFKGAKYNAPFPSMIVIFTPAPIKKDHNINTPDKSMISNDKEEADG